MFILNFLSEYHSFAATNILIAGGYTRTLQTWVLSLRQNNQGSFEATYKPGPDYYKPITSGFGVNCNGRIICGAEWNHSYNEVHNVVVTVENNRFVEINPLTTKRTQCSSLYIPLDLVNQEGLLLVAGSSILEGKNTMEYLMINNDFRINKWVLCEDNLPCSIAGHQMNLLQNKIILTGGMADRIKSNKAWLGTISFNKKFRVNWSPLSPMMDDRYCHVAIVIQEKLFCIGGCGNNTTEYFSFETNSWEKGPDLPFTLNTAKAVLTKQQNQCLLLGGYRDNKESRNIILFDPITGVTILEGSLDRNIAQFYIAVLI